MAAPSVYSAVHAVSADFVAAGIAKDHTNVVDQYDYRSIDDVLNRLSPLLAKHRLCVLPRVIEREVQERVGLGDALLLNVCVRVAYSLVSVDDGSCHVVESFGEALDPGDKATAKALSAAYKQAMLQAFCVPVSGTEDADARGYQLSRQKAVSEPVEGWELWVRDLQEIVSVCETERAINLLQEKNRVQLTALQREQSQLYAELGKAFADRRRTLANRFKKETSPKKNVARSRRQRLREEAEA